MDLIRLRYCWSKTVYLFIYVFVCLWICFIYILIMMGYQQEAFLKVSWRSGLILLRYLSFQKEVKMTIKILWPTWSFPESFMKIWLDLYGFFCFVFALITARHTQEVSLKVLWISKLIWLRYLGSIFLFVCLFVCLCSCFLSFK